MQWMCLDRIYIGFLRFLMTRGIGNVETPLSPAKRAQYGTAPITMMVPFASTANVRLA